MNMDDLEKAFKEVRSLQVQTPQGFAGNLVKESRYSFQYPDGSDPSVAVGLLMPVRAEGYAAGNLFGPFGMNRAEGYLRHRIDEHFKRFGAVTDIFILYLTGQSQIGRLEYSNADYPLEKLKAESLSDILTSPSAEYFDYLLSKYALRSGISGAQPKTLVPILSSSPANSASLDRGLDDRGTVATETVIVKAEGADFPDIARNEFFCISVAKNAGMAVPGFWLSDDSRLFVMDRFDRTPAGGKIGFEDFTVLTRRTADEKYVGSYEMIAKAVAVYAGDDKVRQAQRLFDRVALSCLLRDGDAHLKNFGMLYDHPDAPRELAPVFDVVNTDLYPDLVGRLALKMGGSNTFPTPDDLIAYAEKIGVSSKYASATLDRINTAIESTLKQFKDDPRYQDDLLDRLEKTIFRVDWAPQQKKPERQR